MRIGTSHFVSISAAYKYYADYDLDEYEVDVKLLEGDIKIGMPRVKEGQKVVLDKTEGRYFIEED